MRKMRFFECVNLPCYFLEKKYFLFKRQYHVEKNAQFREGV